jgi:hypothetical protein
MNQGEILVTRGHLFGGGETPLSRGFISFETPAPIATTKFFFDSIQIVDQVTLRARFSSTPKTGSGPIEQRGDTPANWLLSGPTGSVQILTASPFINDAEVIDLGLTTPLRPGHYSLSVIPTLLDAFGNSLSAH